MAHDPERTRAKLHAAAVSEFSTYGYGGARVDRICREAGVNKERLYAYFGSKRDVFERVLADQLASALDATAVTGTGAVAAVGFATAYFDACLQAADLPRLVAWEGLELTQPVNLVERRARASRKVDELHLALPRLTRDQVEDFMLSVVTLCHGWITSPNVGRIVAGDEGAHERRRTAIARAAEALADG